MTNKFISTKTYTHAEGLSCVFRQWKAKHSHCQYLHGYAIQVQIKFSSNKLDDRNWVVDFGSCKQIKNWLKESFDHKLVVDKNDPELEFLKTLEEKNIAQLTILNGVGCEKFAEHIADMICKDFLPSYNENFKNNVKLLSVEVREHDGNSAIYNNV